MLSVSPPLPSGSHPGCDWLSLPVPPSSTVAGTCETTSYPRDHAGHLLLPFGDDGRPVPGWSEVGTSLRRLTYPGRLDFVCGTQSTYAAFDLALLKAGPRGRFVCLHLEAPWDTEMLLLPSNSKGELGAVVRSAFDLVQRAQTQLARFCVVHCQNTWDQNPWYFPIVVARAVAPECFSPGQDLCLNNAAALDRASNVALW